MAKSVMQQAVCNQLAIRRDSISRTEKALEMAVKLQMSKTEIQRLQKQIYDMCLADVSPDGGTSLATPPTVALATAVLAASSASSAVSFPPANMTSPPSSPPARRQCLLDTPEKGPDFFDVDVMDISQFSQQDVAHDGNCGFHVMKIIYDLHIPSLSSRYTHESLRKEVVRVMKAESASIFLARRNCDISGPFNIYIHDEMQQESGCIDDYCSRMEKDCVYCGLNEFAAFVHMLGDGIVIFYCSTKVVCGTREIVKLARESVRPTAREYYVLHQDGRDGRDGHFMFLTPVRLGWGDVPVAECD